MPQTLVFGERRFHERKECILPVDINEFQNFSRGNLRNIALGGAFIETSASQDLQLGLEIAMTIPYHLKPRKITIMGRVVRVSSTGVGIAFIPEHRYA